MRVRVRMIWKGQGRPALCPWTASRPTAVQKSSSCPSERCGFHARLCRAHLLSRQRRLSEPWPCGCVAGLMASWLHGCVARQLASWLRGWLDGRQDGWLIDRLAGLLLRLVLGIPHLYCTHRPRFKKINGLGSDRECSQEHPYNTKSGPHPCCQSGTHPLHPKLAICG